MAPLSKSSGSAFYAAAMSGAYIIDADPAGRAVPEITHSTYYIEGLPAAPIVMANEFGEAIICENVMDDARAEHIVRALSMVSRNDIAAIDHALKISEIRDAVIPGAISMALEMGKSWREARAKGEDMAANIAKKAQGSWLFAARLAQTIGKPRTGLRSAMSLSAGPVIS